MCLILAPRGHRKSRGHNVLMKFNCVMLRINIAERIQVIVKKIKKTVHSGAHVVALMDLVWDL